MKIKEFEAIYPEMHLVASPDSFFGSQKKEFPYYREGGFFNKTEEKALYIYKIIQEDVIRIGLVASTAIQDVKQGHIKKHEETLAEKEQKMLRLVLQRSAMIKPVLLAHRSNKDLLALYLSEIKGKEPFIDVFFEIENTQHKIFKVTDPKVKKEIKQHFANMESVYIADGHHRVSTGLILNRNKKTTHKNYEDLLSIYFGFDQLTIYDYNRIVSVLKEISPTNLMAKLSKYFEVEIIDAPQKPNKKFEICMILDGCAYMLSWKQKYLDMFAHQSVILDAELLDKFVFTEIIGITDIRHDSRLSYISGVDGVRSVEKELLTNDYGVGFLLYPVSSEELRIVADEGKTLPPKSTWFEPRIKNGVISQEF